jgi:hypothetical protein
MNRFDAGIIKFAGGGSYEGQFEADKIHGKGTYTFANGDIYQGSVTAGDVTG